MKRLAVALACLGLVVAADAQAYYGNGAQIVSAHFGRLEQADDATQFAAVSGNGQYVVFQTRARNLFADDDPDPPGQFRQGGLFRMNLATRALELVGDGDFRDEASGLIAVRGAQNPSVSHDGRWVAFSTGQQLVPADLNGNIDVYVRDMSVPIRAPGAFELVSALDGGDEAASYGPREPDTPGLNLGTEVTRGAALSADGNRIVFRTIEVDSNLPEGGPLDSGPYQVLVRDRAANTTTLATAGTADGLPAGGAIGPASLSADGTTVLWTGRNAPAQTRFVDGENPDPNFVYYLWRRLAGSPAGPARRVTGVSDPDDPGCPPGSSAVFDAISTGPCFGPLTQPELVTSNFNVPAALSGDGQRVLFLTTAGPRPNATTGPGLDLYLADMTPGLSRKQATLELTREGLPNDATSSAPIESVSLSADGTRAAITTVRTNFVLPVIRPVGSARAVALARELYVLDLQSLTYERALRGYSGDDVNGDVATGPTLSADGGVLAFVSSAGNLLFGDANERPDAFVARRQAEPLPTPPGGPRSSDDAGVIVEEDPQGPEIRVRASARRGGVVRLRVAVPAPGTVTATARGRVPKLRGRRVLARVTKFSPRPATVELTLRVVRRYKRPLRRAGRLRARVSVTFSPSRGGRRLNDLVTVRFRK